MDGKTIREQSSLVHDLRNRHVAALLAFRDDWRRLLFGTKAEYASY